MQQQQKLDVSGRPIKKSQATPTTTPNSTLKKTKKKTAKKREGTGSDSDTALAPIDHESFHDDGIAQSTAAALRDMDEHDRLLSAHQPRTLDSCSTFGYCFGFFSRTACRVATGAGAAAGAAYGLGLPTTQLPIAALIGAVGAVVARCGDDIFEASRTVDARVQGEVGIGRQLASVVFPLPEPQRAYKA